MDRNLMNALLETIAEAGERGAPEGHMYAAVMGRCDLESFQAVLGLFQRKGLITRAGHVARPTAMLLEAVERAKAKAV